MNLKLLITAISLLQFLIGATYSARILVISALCTGSEANFFNPIIIGLANSGHEVTSVTSKKLSKMPSNVIQLEPVNHAELYGDTDPFKMKERNEDVAMLYLDIAFFTTFCEKVYENKEFQEKVLNQKFDIVLSSSILHQCFHPLAWRNEASLILLSSFPISNYLLSGLGTYFPPSFIPYPTLHYSDTMTFFERAHNFLGDVSLQILNEFSYIEIADTFYRKYVTEGKNYPGLREIQQNVSLILMNTFFAYNFHRPLLPDVIEVGGLHCQPAQPLKNDDLENFISPSAAPEGFIYFSLGTMVPGKRLPAKTRDVFIRVFSKLKQRVLWKWEGDGEMPGCPPNVKVSSFFPQKDILGHPNIRFFITHGGLFSTQETIYYGVPVIGAPVYFDQFTNIQQAAKQGYALEIDIYDLKEEQLQWAVDQMLTNTTYKEKASYMSKVFHDQKETPLERALFWIEYVIRHKGAPHLRSASRKLYWYQYHSVDVIFSVFVVIITFILLFIYILKRVVKYLFYSKFKSPVSSKRKRQ